MNVSPQSENIGNIVHVRGAHAPGGVKLMPKHDANRGSDDSDDEDEDFLALMNDTKKKESTAPDAFQGSAGLPGGGGFQSDDHASFQLPAASDPPRTTSAYDRPQERPSPPGQQASFGGAPASSFRSLEEEKQHFLYKVQRLQNRYPGRKVGLETPLDELKYEYDRLVRQSEMSASVKFQRRALMATVSGFEYLNKSFNPLGLHLDGWSEQVMDSLEDFDQSFEQLHDKYQGSAEVSPEWNIMMTLLGSGFMFHLSNSLFKSVLPNVNDVARNNPDLMGQIASAMGSAMNNQNTQIPPAASNSSQMGAALAMQAMQNKLRPSGPSVDDDESVESYLPPGFEQAAALRKPMPNLARPVSQQRIEEVDDYSGDSGGSDVSSEMSFSDGGGEDVRTVGQQPPKRVASSGGRKPSAKKAKNSVEINL